MDTIHIIVVPYHALCLEERATTFEVGDNGSIASISTKEIPVEMTLSKAATRLLRLQY